MGEDGFWPGGAWALETPTGAAWAEVALPRGREVVFVSSEGDWGAVERVRIETYESDGVPLVHCTVRPGGRERLIHLDGREGTPRATELTLDLSLSVTDAPAAPFGAIEIGAPERWGRFEFGPGQIQIRDAGGQVRLELRTAGGTEAPLSLYRRGRAVALLVLRDAEGRPVA